MRSQLAGLRFLILPFGVSPPSVGNPAIVLDPGPPPSIKLYTGAATELAPAIIQALVSSSRPQLQIVGPDTTASAFGPARINMGIADSNNESFAEWFVGDLAFFDNSLATPMLALHGAESFELPVEPFVSITQFTSNNTRMDPQNASSSVDDNTNTNTSYGASAANPGFSFVGPPSGRGLIWVHARITINTTAAVHRRVNVAPRLGTGSTVGGGTAQTIQSLTTPDDDVSLDFTNAFANGSVTSAFGATWGKLSGLVHGDPYNLALRFKLNSAVSANYDILSQAIGWLPLY
jgi:hypothetical protein